MRRSLEAAPVREQEKVDYETLFYSLEERLDAASKATIGYKTIMAALDDDDNYKKAYINLQKYVEKRERAIDGVHASDMRGNMIPENNIRQEFDNIRLAQSNPDAFLGNGAVAEVFSVKSMYKSQDVCVKVVHDEKRYGEGNSVHREVSFLDVLQDVEVEGVRTPMPYYSFSTVRMRGYTMEQLDAVNIRRVIEGKARTNGEKEVLPDNFDVKDFFVRLRKYFATMHALGIVHGDVALRNLMVDRKTGMPRVIDFGKAKFLIDLDKSNINSPDYVKSDIAALDAAQQELQEWLADQETKKVA